MTATRAQKKRLRDLVGTGSAHGVNIALGEIDGEGLERALDNGDELRVAVIQTITSKLRELSIPNEFADEEVVSSYGYLSGYRKPKSITEQCNILRKLFPGVGNALEKLAEQPVLTGAEGWFAIPKWQTIAPTYGEAVEKVLAKLSQTREGKFYNYCKGQLGPDRLRQSIKAFQKLEGEQKDYDILVVAAQFGINHRGRSVRRACEVMNSQEFGLGAFAVGIMLLSHPERLQHYDDLWIDCAGDEYDCLVSGVRFDYAPGFRFEGGGVSFGTRWASGMHVRYGSASGFLPQR